MNQHLSFEWGCYTETPFGYQLCYISCSGTNWRSLCVPQFERTSSPFSFLSEFCFFATICITYVTTLFQYPFISPKGSFSIIQSFFAFPIWSIRYCGTVEFQFMAQNVQLCVQRRLINSRQPLRVCLADWFLVWRMTIRKWFSTPLIRVCPIRLTLTNSLAIAAGWRRCTEMQSRLLHQLRESSSLVW